MQASGLILDLDKNLIKLNNQIYLEGKLVVLYLDKTNNNNNNNNSKNQEGYLELVSEQQQQHQRHKIQPFLKHNQHKIILFLDSHNNNNNLEDYFQISNNQISNHNKGDFLVNPHNLQAPLHFNSLNNKDY